MIDNHEAKSIAKQLFYIQLNLRYYECNNLDSILNYLIDSDSNIKHHYESAKYNNLLKKCNDKEIRYDSKYIKNEYIIASYIGEYIQNILGELKDPEPLFYEYEELVEFLSYYHRGVFQYMHGKGYLTDIFIYWQAKDMVLQERYKRGEVDRYGNPI